MGKTLTKDWNRAAAGTVITTDPAELAAGAVLVDPARFAYLEAQGFFAVEPDASFAAAFADREVEVADRTAGAPGLAAPKADVWSTRSGKGAR